VPTMRFLALLTAAAAAAIGASLAAGMAVGPRGQLSSAETAQGQSGAVTGSGRPAGPARAGTWGEQVSAAAPPAAGYRQGGLVPGYPGRVVPAVPGTTDLSTSIAPSGHRMQAALVGRVAGDQATVLQFYRARLTQLGFSAQQRPAGTGSTALGFTRRDCSVVVTATPGHQTSYSVFAVLTVGGAGP